MRGLAVVNPKASSYDRGTAQRSLRILEGALDLEVVETTRPGHAVQIVAERSDGLDAVVVLGGDGTVSEALGGLLEPAPAAPPLLAALPFGCVSVFSRHLGLPASPEQAAVQLADRLATRQPRPIGVGRVVASLDGAPAGERWFCLSVGIGFDADIVAAVERRRSGGRPASTLLYARCAVGEFFRPGPRPRMRLSIDGHAGEQSEAVIVGNHAPWTYAGNRPIWATPCADWSRGLDVMTLARLSLVPTLRQLARMVGRRPPPRNGGGVRHHLDLDRLDVTASAPARWQVDGDALPAATSWTITAHPQAVSVPL
jgi:diacylglycerol kinase family enzyme